MYCVKEYERGEGDFVSATFFEDEDAAFALSDKIQSRRNDLLVQVTLVMHSLHGELEEHVISDEYDNAHREECPMCNSGCSFCLMVE